MTRVDFTNSYTNFSDSKIEFSISFNYSVKIWEHEIDFIQRTNELNPIVIISFGLKIFCLKSFVV
jgi:hypothetical protein